MKAPLFPRLSAAVLRRTTVCVCLLSVLTALLSPTRLRAETTSSSGATQITGLPFTISASGVYFLQQDFAVNQPSGACITVNASNVTIDLNGHTITNTNGQTNRCSGIYSIDESNITVRNGNINGFWIGTILNASSYSDSTSLSFAHLIENMCFTKSIYSSAQALGYGNRLYRCRAVLGGNSGQSAQSVSFVVFGLYDTIEDCDVMGAFGTTAPSYGITIGHGGDCFAVNNRISGTTYGIIFHDSTVKYRDTLTVGVTTPYDIPQGITPIDAGNNQ